MQMVLQNHVLLCLWFKVCESNMYMYIYGPVLELFAMDPFTAN